jgi:hypothetical protein
MALSVAAALWLAGDKWAAADAVPVLAGVARVDLTPPLAMKAALGGYGARLSKPATGIHDAVWAKALVLSSGERRFALVTADVLAFPPQFKGAVLAQLTNGAWTADRVLLLPSHSHTSLDMMALHPGNDFTIPQVGLFQRELLVWTAQRLAQAVQAAAQVRVPVQAGSVVVTVADRNRNRRGGRGPRDTDLTVTRIDAAPGRPLAVLVNWTAHPTFMDADDMWFSGDWPGHLQRTVEALIGQDVTVLFYNGAEGDQSPVPPATGRSGWERAERYGRDLGIRAYRAWEGMRPRVPSVFRYATSTIELPARRPHPDFMKTGGAEYGLNAEMAQGFIERLVPPQTHSTGLRLDELVVLGVPGEMAAALGLAVKSQARTLTGATCVTIGGLADEWTSYVLPAEEYQRGGYEASMSFYGDTLGATMMEGMVRAAKALR